MTTPLADLTPEGWTEALEAGPVTLLRYPETYRVRHICDRGPVRTVIVWAPKLVVGHGLDWPPGGPATVTGSILCGDCGLHGWIRDSQWVTA